jgi:hypothetical protein
MTGTIRGDHERHRVHRSAGRGPARPRRARHDRQRGLRDRAELALALVKGFVVAAFLSRSEYGIWGILVLVSLLWLKQVRIGDKYVQQREGDQALAFQKAFTSSSRSTRCSW